MLNPSKYKNPGKSRLLLLLAFIVLLNPAFNYNLVRKNVVEFKAEDGVTVTADNYFLNKKSPYILLFHQERSSRGEYDSIAERFVRLGYNCLAVDLRSGDRYGFVKNATANSLGDETKTALESLKDIKAAVGYAYSLSNEKVILLGSASSASLVLIEAKTNDLVKAAISLSPGEYFQPAFDMKSYLSGFSKKVFAGCTLQEYLYVEDMMSEIDPANKTIFKPSSGNGERGSAALLRESSNRDEYWLSLLIFFNSIK